MKVLPNIVQQGSILVYMAGAVPPVPPIPIPNTDPGNQPIDQKLQGYPQARGLMVISNEFVAEMGVSVDELTQP